MQPKASSPSSSPFPKAPAPTALSLVPALQRGLALLQELATRPNGATQTELASALDLSQTAIHRLVLALESLGYVHKNPATRSVRVTQKLLLLGQPHSGSRSLIEAALPAMRDILSLTNETTQLCVLAEARCILIEQLASKHPFKYVVDLGSQSPPQCCAPGKAMLAFLPEAEQHHLIDQIEFVAYTPHSITSRSQLLEELARIRLQGYALDRGEHFEGIHCIAAPLLDAHQHPIAALTIAGPSSRIPESTFHPWGLAIQEAASAAALRFLL